MADKRLLLVEDEAGLRLTLGDRLSSEGYLVATASDGEAGLAEAATGGYDVIVLDVMLPRINGFDLCREVRRRGVTTPILTLTARGQVADNVAGLRQKIEINPKAPEYLLTIHGLGYKFVG